MTDSNPNENIGLDLGIFQGITVVGQDQQKGSVTFIPESDRYVITGSGENMWDSRDEFVFVWMKVTGDIALSADIKILGLGKHFHRKACLILRQSLDFDAICVYAAAHVDGMVALQHRIHAGGPTVDTQSHIRSPRRLRIVKVGNLVTMYACQDGVHEEFAGTSTRINLEGEFYVGLGVCSHDPSDKETAIFSNVVIEKPEANEGMPVLYSTLEKISYTPNGRIVVACIQGHIEAPNWTPDGHNLVYNSGGKLYRVSVSGGESELIDTGFANRCNNDHGISPDGEWIAISDQSQPPHESVIYTVPATGGEPKRITENAPSYWHGWSPDGKTLAFCGRRDGKFGIFTIPADGGDETRLTITDGLDDGPDYSIDGRYIYFNSDRTGLMQIWRMKTDGSELTQITKDGMNDWFPHPSPDGKWISFVSYRAEVQGHPPDQEVKLRVLSLETGSITVLADLFGGQGTINVPSWSPCSNRLAFVSYHYIKG